MELALAAALIADAKAVGPTIRLALVLCSVPVGVAIHPRFCDLGRTIEAVGSLYRGGEPDRPPLGYTHAYPRKPYPWRDYRQALAFLRTSTSTRTRVANALKGNPAVTGAVGRLPVFPAESLAWIQIVKPDDEGRFVRALEDTSDSVVVWAPSEADDGKTPRMPDLIALIRRLYEPAARFGDIEVWRRKRPIVEAFDGPRISAAPSDAPSATRRR
jgi:hypothetical protein